MNENNENHENTLPKPYPIFVSMKTPHIVLLGPTFPYRGGNALFMTFLYEALEERHRIDFINFRMMYPAILFPGTTPYDVSEEHFQKVPSLRLMHSINPVSGGKLPGQSTASIRISLHLTGFSRFLVRCFAGSASS
ncbi:MAG: hypothetical protein IPJ06_08740 [Saprospiraceae bacterium]|nr:hypothetical protein [Saprospiraceae bacterium]